MQCWILAAFSQGVKKIQNPGNNFQFNYFRVMNVSKQNAQYKTIHWLPFINVVEQQMWWTIHRATSVGQKDENGELSTPRSWHFWYNLGRGTHVYDQNIIFCTGCSSPSGTWNICEENFFLNPNRRAQSCWKWKEPTFWYSPLYE